MEFRVKPATSADITTPPNHLVLPAAPPLGPADLTRRTSLNEEESESVRVTEDDSGNVVLDCWDGELFGPTAALLGTVNPDGSGHPLGWDEAITENPAVGATEVWDIHNLTVDAHPIHVHLVKYEVVEREDANGSVRPPEPWETGYKDAVIVIRAR